MGFGIERDYCKIQNTYSNFSVIIIIDTSTFAL